ncbi:MAG: NusG domain II-containing protein [Candidatus Aminicenantes bacterium]|nr:MAG: NusG domain II-containing protein [Candidatus Aminicenantes bacterium]
MDRRDFFKTIFATPLLAPFLLDSPSTANEELFLISDSPETHLPPLLEGLRRQNRAHGRSYVFLDMHPQKTALSQALRASGWTEAISLQKADLTLSFRPLQHPSPPSFMIVRAGKIVDIRTKELFSFWKKLNEKHSPSSCLTIAAIQTRHPVSSPGTFVRVYHNGHVVEEASLKKNGVQTFWAERGKVTMKIEQEKAFIPSSSCRHKICCSAPPVSISGERIVCAPNHFLLEIQGSGSIDTIIG